MMEREEETWMTILHIQNIVWTHLDDCYFCGQ